MSYSVRPGNVFGRIGEGLGKGLSESIPKEAERIRLKQGLEELEKEKGLTQFQKLSRLGTLPGVTPSLTQSLGNLLQTEAIGDAYRSLSDKSNISKEKTTIPERDSAASSRSLDDIKFGAERKRAIPGISSGENIGAVSTGPLSEEKTPRRTWTTQQVRQRESELFDIFKNRIPYSEIKSMVKEEEERARAQPLYEQELEARSRNAEDQFEKDFRAAIGLKTQKDASGKEIFVAIPGEDLNNLLNMGRGLIATRPDLNTRTVAEKLAEVGNNAKKAKDELETLAEKGYTSLSPSEFRRQISSLSKLATIAGNEEPTKNFLIEKFGISPQQAAKYAYENSPEVEKSIKNIKPNIKMPADAEKALSATSNFSKYVAKKIIDNISPNDSVLKILSDIRDKYSNFNEKAFLAELEKSPEKLNERQKREAASATSPQYNWYDFWLNLPW